MSLKRLAGETAIYGISSILGRLLNFVLITPFVTRPEVFTPEQYGVVGDLFFYTAFLIAFLVFRLDTAVFRFASRPEYSARAVCRNAQNMIIIGVVVVIGGGLLLAPRIADWMSYPDRVTYIQLFLLIVAFDALSAIPLARLRLEQRPWFFAGVNLVNIAVNIVLIYLLLKFLPDWIASGHDFSWYDERFKISYYFVAILVAAIVKFLILIGDRWWRDYRSFRLQGSNEKEKSHAPLPLREATAPRSLRPPSNDSGEEILDDGFIPTPPKTAPTWTEMLIYAAPLVIVAVCGIVNTLVGPTMLKNYYGEDVSGNLYWSGQYAAAMKLAVFLTLFTTAYNFAAEPFFFRHSGKDPERTDLMIYANASRAFALMTSLAIAGILLLLPILQFYLGRNLREGLEVLPILLAANFMLGLYYSFAMAYKLTDKTYLGGLIALVGAAIVVGGNILFIEDYGIFAPAWAGLACFFVMSVLAYLVSRRHFPVPYPIGRFFLYALATAGVVYLGWDWENTWARVGLLIVYTLGMTGFEWRWLRGLV